MTAVEKLELINKKLSGLSVIFEVMPFGPRLKYLDSPCEVVCTVENRRNIAYFYIMRIYEYTNYSGDKDELSKYLNYLGEVQDILDYCNELGFEIDKFSVK